VHFTILKSPTEALHVAATSRVIKAAALAELVWAADLHQSFQAELEQAKRMREEALQAARAEGYQAGERQAHAELAERLTAAGQFLAQAHAVFEVAFSRAVTGAVAQIARKLPDAVLMQAILRHAYLALGRELMMSITIHPEDRDATQEALKSLTSTAFPAIVADASMPRHACRIESQLAVVEHDLTAILAGIERATLLALRESAQHGTEAS
jgi:type III secretion protein L